MEKPRSRSSKQAAKTFSTSRSPWTISGTREDFWWLNNGITIVASQATQGGKALNLEDPQVVNGLQTSTEIFNYFRCSNTEGDERNLLVRVIVPREADSRDRIIKATNSQTYIPPASLRATDKIQRDIEEYLKPFGLYYDRRKNFYKNEGRPIENIVSIPLMAQAAMSIILRRPDAARARPSSLLNSDADYDDLFDVSHPIQIYRLCVVILRKVEAVAREMGIAAKERNNIKFYAAMFAAAMACQKAQPTVQDLCLLKPEAFGNAEIGASLVSILAEYQDLGGTDQIAKGPLLLAKTDEAVRKRLAS